MGNFKCKDKGMALAVLSTVAESMKGTQREAILAVKSWLMESVPAPLGPETLQKLSDIFEGKDEGEPPSPPLI
jgi:hypothetical protein